MDGKPRSLKNYFTVGEFAKLCNTTKDTLYHYERLGILKPDHVSDNGYRYYSVKQFYEYDIIATLKEVGSSLEEINHYIHHHEVEIFLQMLLEKQRELDREYQKILRMRRLLSNTILQTRYALCEPLEQPKLVECEEEYCIAVALDMKKDQVKEEVARLRDLYAYLEEQDIDAEFPMGFMVPKETLLTGVESDCYLYSKISRPIQSDWLHIKPKGAYLVMLHQGNYDSIPDAYQVMLNYIGGHGLVITGNAYEYELIGYLAVGDENRFVEEIAIQVE